MFASAGCDSDSHRCQHFDRYGKGDESANSVSCHANMTVFIGTGGVLDYLFKDIMRELFKAFVFCIC